MHKEYRLTKEGERAFYDFLHTKDTDKQARLELLPPHAIEEVSVVLRLGEQKYGKFDYLSNPKLSQTNMIGKALRHITTFLKGYHIDPEISRHHLAHAAADLLIALEMQLLGKGKDDRK